MVDFHAKLKELKLKGECIKMAKPIRVDFTKTEDSGFYVPPGEYTVKCKKVEEKQGEAAPYLDFVMEVDGYGVTLHQRCTLKPDALFKLKETLGALMNREIPKSVVNIDPDKLVGRVCTALIKDREYNGKTYADIAKLIPYKAPAAPGKPTDDLDEELPF